jgi:hypothetical protein
MVDLDMGRSSVYMLAGFFSGLLHLPVARDTYPTASAGSSRTQRTYWKT